MENHITHVLVIEDNGNDQLEISRAFEDKPEFAVTYARNAKDGERELYGKPYDIAVVDKWLPDKSGHMIILDARAAKLTLPILMLTGDGQESSIIENINGGANGYMTKPFLRGEFIARINGLVRDANRTADPLIPFGDLVFDTARDCVRKDGARLFDMPPKQARLFEALLRSRTRYVSEETLLSAGWRDEKPVKYMTVRRNVDRINECFARNGLPSVVRYVTGEGHELVCI